MKGFTTHEWVMLIVSLVVLAAGLTSFTYAEFVTKEAFKDQKSDLNYRLERIERKLDQVLTGSH